MSKRLQVVMSDKELRGLQRAAARDGLSVSEWVRRALHDAQSLRSTGDPDRKLVAIRAAVRHDFPTADIDSMLGDIERGYLSGSA